LKSFGKDVDTCNSVAEGLDMISKKFYHMVFLSAVIGDITGLQCAKKIRQLAENRNPKITLIGIIETVSNRTVNDCIKAGMDDFVA
jgi:CheY-like chemotaxis protein